MRYESIPVWSLLEILKLNVTFYWEEFSTPHSKYDTDEFHMFPSFTPQTWIKYIRAEKATIHMVGGRHWDMDEQLVPLRHPNTNRSNPNILIPEDDCNNAGQLR